MQLDRDAWLSVCREAARSAASAIDAFDLSDRGQYSGTVGAGGDRTLKIDAAAEQAIFDVLGRVHADGFGFTACSEERGEVACGATFPRLLIDPIDGSLNGGRSFGHHAVSIAVATGPSVPDVELGYVYDLSTAQEWHARAGEGAWLDGTKLKPTDERRTDDGRLELIAIEAADPVLLQRALPELLETTRRIRALGAIALSLCHVAAGSVDGMITLWRCRPVDAAAGQLIARETGAFVEWTGSQSLADVPLNTAPLGPLVAARSERGLAELSRATAYVPVA